ncbi:MAG: hypothetical protein FWH17_05105 [Oscillospiraceae bacterium]|nr:hypothetical protein [Oscillospiraceae bacterium]
MRFNDVIDKTFKRGLKKYKKLEGKGGNSTEYPDMIKKWDAETKFALGYMELVAAKSKEELGFPLDLLTRSANEGFWLAQYMLGNCYKEGHGVKKDENLARQWWEKAAAQGLDDAKEKLST